jgi:hypothetical protein
MRTITSFAVLALVAGCGASSGSADSVTYSQSSATTGADAGQCPPSPAALWIFNQGGSFDLADFFDCMLSASSWNALATAYPGARPLRLAQHILVQPDAQGQYPCTSQVGSQAYYQCAVNAGQIDMAPGDVLLVVRPDGTVGGLDNQYGSDPTNIAYGPNGGVMSVTNPFTGAAVDLDAAHVGNATQSNPQLLFVYAAHEVFEAQTDGISADCCDGETSTGGPLPVCPDCGPYQDAYGRYGACGRYSAPGGSWGIASITCPSGKTYEYQQVSPPGAHRYGSAEFDGTCQSIKPLRPQPDACAGVFGANDGAYCGGDVTGGFSGGNADWLYDCREGVTVSTTTCPGGCHVAPPGQADTCN